MVLSREFVDLCELAGGLDSLALWVDEQGMYSERVGRRRSCG